jgi:hypothetical protein
MKDLHTRQLHVGIDESHRATEMEQRPCIPQLAASDICRCGDWPTFI